MNPIFTTVLGILSDEEMAASDILHKVNRKMQDGQKYFAPGMNQILGIMEMAGLLTARDGVVPGTSVFVKYYKKKDDTEPLPGMFAVTHNALEVVPPAPVVDTQPNLLDSFMAEIERAIPELPEVPEPKVIRIQTLVLANTAEEALKKYNALARKRKKPPFGWEQATIDAVQPVKAIL